MSDRSDHVQLIHQIEQQIVEVSESTIKLVDAGKAAQEEEQGKLVALMAETLVDFPVNLEDVDIAAVNKVIATINRRSLLLQHIQVQIQPHVTRLRSAHALLRHLVNTKAKKISVEGEKVGVVSTYLSKAFGDLRCVDEAQVVVEAKAVLDNLADFVKSLQHIREDNKAFTQDAKYQHKMVGNLEEGAALGTVAPQPKAKKKEDESSLDPLATLGTSLEAGTSIDLPASTTRDVSQVTGIQPRLEADPKVVESLLDDNMLGWDEKQPSIPEDVALPPSTPVVSSVDDAMANLFDPSPTGAALPPSTEAPVVHETPEAGEILDPVPPPLLEDFVTEEHAGYIEDVITDKKLQWRVFREMGITGDQLQLNLYPSRLIEALREDPVGVNKLGKKMGFYKDQTNEETYELFKDFVRDFAEPNELIQRVVENRGQENEKVTQRYEIGPRAETYEQWFAEVRARVEETAKREREQMTEGEAVADIMVDLEQASLAVDESKPASSSPMHAMLERKADDNINIDDLLEGSASSPQVVQEDPKPASERDTGYETSSDEKNEERVFWFTTGQETTHKTEEEIQKKADSGNLENVKIMLATPEGRKEGWKNPSDFGIVAKVQAQVEVVPPPPPPLSTPSTPPTPSGEVSSIEDILGIL